MEDVMYKERMLVEFEELVERISRAKAKCDADDEDLFKQIAAMEEYKRCLAIRILKEMGRY